MKSMSVPLKFHLVNIAKGHLETTFEARSSGMTLDPCLKFDLQLRNIVNMMSKLVLIFCKFRKLLDENYLKIIYYSYTQTVQDLKDTIFYIEWDIFCVFQTNILFTVVEVAKDSIRCHTSYTVLIKKNQ